MNLRLARPDDAAAIVAILDPLVRDTAMNFAYEPPEETELAARIETALATHPWIVADDGRVLGFSFARPYGAQPGTAWVVETGIALGDGARGRKVGTQLYGRLLAVLRAQGYTTAFAAITVPNPASERLHVRHGYEKIGVFRKSGYKHGAWHDTSWWQRTLIDGTAAPAPPRRPADVF